MAGVFYDNFVFKYIFAFLFSTSQAILQFTLFDASTRGMFIVMFPLLFYLLLKKNQLWKNAALLILYLIFLRSVHNFFYFALPPIFSMILIYILLRMNLVTKKELKINVRNERLELFKKVNFTHIYTILILCSFLAPFFMNLFIEGSRYDYLKNIFITTTRYIGPLIFITFGGITYILLKKEKKNVDWLILISSLFFIPISYSSNYGKFIIVPFVIFFVAVGLKNILLFSINRKLHLLFFIFILMSSVLFSSFYNNYRTGDSQTGWYMDERVNEAGIWSRSCIPENTHVFTTVGEVWRMLAVSNGHIEFPSLSPLELVYGFVNESEVINNTLKYSFTSMDFYFESPYYQKSKTSKLGEYYWIMGFEINDERVKYFMEKYNIKYIVYDAYADRGHIIGSVEKNNDLIFDNNRIKIWLV
jgi:hypothetical protein